MSDIHWQHYAFNELQIEQLHSILEARQAVFVLEQQCLYPDIDILDKSSWHLLGSTQNNNELIAYLRLIPPGLKFAGPGIGRVLVTQAHRGNGIGEVLMRQGMALAAKLYPQQSIRIAAQIQLKEFYQGLGFTVVSEPYDDDGIVHIDMVSTNGQAA